MSTSFSDLGVPARLVEALAADGINEAFPVQAATLPDALAGKDLCGRAPTGSGKTLGFGIPMMVRISQAEPTKPTGLVLVPTRELAEQVQRAFVPLGRAQWRFIQAIYGGASFGPQIHSLRKGASVVVATPGRLLDIIEKGYCDLSAVEVCVIDEADRMADLGFMPDVRKILDMTPDTRQTMLWSATLDGDVNELIRDYMKDPVTHDLVDESDAAPVDHKFVVTRPTERLDAAVALIEEHGPTIVFVKTRFGVDDVSEDLNRAGVRAGALHGARSQAVRQRVLEDFKRGKLQALVATDVAARGIHVDNVSLVLHYDMPDNDKDYTHRSGRTGRAGAAGLVIAFVPPSRQRLAERMSEAVPADVTWERGKTPVERVPQGERETGNRNRDERGTRTERPAYGDRPAYGGTRDRGDRPSYGADRNDRGDRGDRPSYGGDRPSYGGDRPSDNRDRPAAGGDRPSYNRDRPSYGADRPTGDRPSYGADRPGRHRDRPSYGGDRPSDNRSGGDRPAYGAGRPSATPDRPGYQGRNDDGRNGGASRDRNDWSPRAPRSGDRQSTDRPGSDRGRGEWTPRAPRADGPPRDRNDWSPRPRRDDDRGVDGGRFSRDDRPGGARSGAARPGAGSTGGYRGNDASRSDRPPFARDGQRPPFGRDGRSDRPWRSGAESGGNDRPRFGGDARPARDGKPGFGGGYKGNNPTPNRASSYGGARNDSRPGAGRPGAGRPYAGKPTGDRPTGGPRGDAPRSGGFDVAAKPRKQVTGPRPSAGKLGGFRTAPGGRRRPDED